MPESDNRGDGRNSKGHFLPGHGGRMPGTRNKLQGKFIDALAKDFDDNGEDIIRIVRIEKPVDYLKLIASILPKEMLIAENLLGDISDDEALLLIAALRKSLAKEGVSTDKPTSAVIN